MSLNFLCEPIKTTYKIAKFPSASDEFSFMNFYTKCAYHTGVWHQLGVDNLIN